MHLCPLHLGMFHALQESSSPSGVQWRSDDSGHNDTGDVLYSNMFAALFTPSWTQESALDPSVKAAPETGPNNEVIVRSESNV